MSRRPAISRDAAQSAATGRNGPRLRRLPRDTVHLNADPLPSSLTPGAAKVILMILLAADRSPPTVSARRDNHDDEPNP
jgi:hypothetical protein